jgi:hypothetical protein
MCTTPIFLKKGTPEAMIVGCGACLPCYIKYAYQWAFRFEVHANENPIFYCITLTYDEKHLPYVSDPKTGKHYRTLMRSHAQKWAKDLRNLHNKRHKIARPKMSYMICGEYGDKFKRPHYHAIVFNVDPADILLSWKDSEGVSRGNIHFGPPGLIPTVKYALKYSLKSKIYKWQKNFIFTRPFVHFSKGIGECLLDPVCVK